MTPTTIENFISYSQVRITKALMRALDHTLRKKMINLLLEKSKMTVTEMYVHLRLEQSICSQHLAILRAHGIVKTERDGKFIYYSIDVDRLKEIQKLVAQF